MWLLQHKRASRLLHAAGIETHSAYWYPTDGYKWWRVETENRKWTEENFSLKAGNVWVCALNQQNEPLPEQPTATLSHLITVGLIVVLQRRWIWKYSWGRLRSDLNLTHSVSLTGRIYQTLCLYSPFLSLILVFYSLEKPWSRTSREKYLLVQFMSLKQATWNE